MADSKKPHVVILGAGLGGTVAAFEIKDALGYAADVTVVNQGSTFHFVPSNPWVAVRWRKRDAIEVQLEPVYRKRDIRLLPQGCSRVRPADSQIDLGDGAVLDYDYLVIATGPELAFDEIEGLGPAPGFTQSVCHVDHAEVAADAFDALAANPGPVIIGAVQGASCFGPAYEFAMILDTELRRRKIRDKVPMTFVTSEPYIGHLGLDGVGDTRGLLESEMRNRHIKWITSARVKKVESGTLHVEAIDDDGSVKATHALPFTYSMMLPAFRGVPAVRDVEGLVNPRGFILADKHQRNPTFPNIYSLGVCVAIPPVGPTPVPVGVPKTGFMIESMVAAIAHNLRQEINDQAPTHEATWNAICLADFGDGGVAFFAQPQIPPRNINWASSGKWVHLAKVGFEKYFIGKVRRGESVPFYERLGLDLIGAHRLKR
ncbi:FAD-dependent oxidoreductase [uncultured Brevundimonas sp.]|uniref:NAD(P)/FAD-dependent oxidoreductase n=1 Tax=uncultured Brevundimonas sp. TaxID=213418 RepID=UPI0030EF7D9E|tara:strand:- start:928 stop:2217 length:1290 start_codon:yes stop_codon:yes gene_type:complete